MSKANQIPEQQSNFFEQQQELQTPPELRLTPEQKKRRHKIIAGISTTIILTLGLIVWISSIETTPEQREVIVSPTPLPTRTPPIIQQRINQITILIDETGKDAEIILPPPVDMDLQP